MNYLINSLYRSIKINKILMKKDIIIFDVDGTLVESSYQINDTQASLLNQLKTKYEIAICGGGTLNKVLEQMDNKIYFDHYFTECGCVYHKNKSKNNLDLKEIYSKNLRDHELYPQINELIKCSLKFFGNVDYLLSGHFIDLRNGIVYVSCVGMQANQKERELFIEKDNNESLRQQLIDQLKEKASLMNIEDKISIKIGGSVGIAIYPNEYDKKQILKTIHSFDYENIIYFGDKYDSEGNDYHLIHAKGVKGHKIDSINQTYKILKESYLNI